MPRRRWRGRGASAPLTSSRAPGSSPLRLSRSSAPECARVRPRWARNGHARDPATNPPTRNCLETMVGRDGIEPPTPGFSVRRHTPNARPHPASHVPIRRVTRQPAAIHHASRRVRPNGTVQVWGKSPGQPHAPTCHAKTALRPETSHPASGVCSSGRSKAGFRPALPRAPPRVCPLPLPSRPHLRTRDSRRSRRHGARSCTGTPPPCRRRRTSWHAPSPSPRRRRRSNIKALYPRSPTACAPPPALQAPPPHVPPELQARRHESPAPMRPRYNPAKGGHGQ
jgi:hypothetical protein